MSPDRIQVDVSYEFKEVRTFLADDRLIAVLKEIAVSSLSLVEMDGIPGQKPSHHGRDRRRASSQQKVNMVGDEGKRVDRSNCLL